MIENAQQIKDILEPIPADKFITGLFGLPDGRSCALGHIHRALSFNGKDDYNGDCNGYGACQLTQRFLSERHDLDFNIAHVNNYSNINGYTEPVIKDRVIHLLNDMIEAGY